jgi:hypothetical protein
VGGSPSSTLTLNQPPASPRAGAGGGIQDTVRSPCRAPCYLTSSTCGVAGEQAVLAGSELTHTRPNNLPCTPTLASVVRGEGSRLVKTTPPLQQPAVIAADFTTLYDRCLASGLKARDVFSHAAGRQTLTVSCIFPAPAETTAAAGKRRRHHRRRRRRGRAATAALDVPARATSPTAAPPAASTPQPEMPTLLPEIAPPPMKKPRKWRNEVELLRDCDESSEIFLSPPPSRGSLHSPPPSSTLQSS